MFDLIPGHLRGVNGGDSGEVTQEKKNKAAKEQAETMDLGNSTGTPHPAPAEDLPPAPPSKAPLHNLNSRTDCPEGMKAMTKIPAERGRP